MTNPPRRLAHSAVLLALACASACSHTAPAAYPIHGLDAEVRDGIARIRAATAGFTSLDSAVAAGYQRDQTRCLASAGEGTMGFHHRNSAYVDGQLDIEKPEILLYERLPGGRYVLNGVEYVVPYSGWPADSVPPVLLGQQLRSYPNLRIWSIHVWIWKRNPAGLFAPWNPAAHCLETPAMTAH
jgi:hypothetical protein